jgi:hypothetical protein
MLDKLVDELHALGGGARRQKLGKLSMVIGIRLRP